ncbi:type II secretion system protein GspL [Gammaproteobacteria bacterium]|nr:type II secretion system protein GspL [Gammaproteobacteria bacterium]
MAGVLVTLYFQVEPPHRWVLVDRRGDVVNEGISETLESIPAPAKLSQAVGVVPGEVVTIHEVELPARSRGKALASAPYALEERLATDVDSLVFTVLDWQSGQRTTVSVIERAYIEALQSEFSTLPFSVTALVPEYFLVPLHPQARYTLARMPNGSFALRTGECNGMMLDENALEYWWHSVGDPGAPVAVNDLDSGRRLIELGGTSISEWDIGTEFPEWLQHGRTSIERINVGELVHGDGGSGETSRLLKVALAVFGLGLLTSIVVDIYENYVLFHENAAVDREIIQVFHETFPEIRRIVNPRLQMEQRITELRAGSVSAGGFQTLLASVARAVPEANATLDEITFRDDAMLITCTTNDFAGLDRLRARFAMDQNISVELISSGSRDNKVNARFRLQRV